jgi:hypothetical protein
VKFPYLLGLCQIGWRRIPLYILQEAVDSLASIMHRDINSDIKSEGSGSRDNIFWKSGSETIFA